MTFYFADTNVNNLERSAVRSYVPNRLANGEVVGFLVFIRDITVGGRTADALHPVYKNL